MAAAIALPVLLGGAGVTWRDYAAGRSRFWLSGGIAPCRVGRDANPRRFWASTLANAAVLALPILACAAFLVMPGSWS